jgi:D-sedoheptulose 7-phosphate isomerase
MRVNFHSRCRPYFELLSRSIGRLPFDQVDAVVDVLLQAYHAQHTIFVFGNGGSAALASHFACDLGKGTVNGSGKRFRVMALTDNVPLLTAWANDSNYENTFSEPLANFAVAGDLAFAISASGNSPNVLKALQWAKQCGLATAGLTGFSGGKMRALCDACIVVPCDNMQIIEDLHLSITHSLFTCIRGQLSQKSRLQPVLRPQLVKQVAER